MLDVFYKDIWMEHNRSEFEQRKVRIALNKYQYRNEALRFELVGKLNPLQGTKVNNEGENPVISLSSDSSPALEE